MRATFKIEGFRELDAALGELPKATARNALVRTLLKAGEPIREAAQAAAPVRSDDAPEVTYSKGRVRRRGTMQALVQIGTRLTKSQGRAARREGKNFAEVYIGTRDPIARLQEFGTADAPAQPFLRPAWEGGKRAALDTIAEELGQQIDAAAKRVAKRAARKAAKGG